MLEKPAQSLSRSNSIDMALDCKLCCLMYILTVTVSGIDISELEIDKSLNPRLVGAIYHLYKPILTSNKATPITIDCNHPSVVCKFGTSTLVTSVNKECNCKDTTTSDVPIISGLTTGEENKNKQDGVIKSQGDVVAITTGNNKESEVPIYKGVVDTDAILNEADQPYNIWNFQRNSLDKGWRPVDDPTNRRIGELPRKFYSYYPFSQPPVTDDFSINFPASMSGQPHFYPGWRRPGAHSPFPSNPPQRPAAVKTSPATSTVKHPTFKQNSKISLITTEVYPIADKISAITPKSASIIDDELSRSSTSEIKLN